MNADKQKDSPRSDQVSRPYFIMELKLLPWQELLISAVTMMALILVVVHFNIPNPNMILIAGLVVSSAIFGYNGGLLAGVLMLLYSMYFFSTDHNYVSYTPLNLEKLIVIIIGISVVLLFVCELKRRSMRAFNQIEELSAKLREDNLLLQEVSLIDPLTNIRNRLALRRDFRSYTGEDVYVMMLDVDDFKGINDRYGHDQGDRILRLTGKSLADHFGQDHCYRYGGDEFLVICPDEVGLDFRRRVENVFEMSPPLNKRDPSDHANYSAGYVSGAVHDERDLRSMISLADERLYAAKRSGKNKIEGGAGAANA